MKKNLRNRLALCVVAGVISVSGGMVAYAATTTATGVAAESTVQGSGGRGMGMGMKMNMDFSSLVSEGKISQETADRITSYMEEQRAAREAERAEAGNVTPGERKAPADGEVKERVDMFSQMVTAGVITQEEADILKAAAPAFGEGQEPRQTRGKMFDMESFVSSGIIDEATAASINSYMDAKMEAFKSEMEKLERPADMELPEGMTFPEGMEMKDGFKMERPEFNSMEVKNPFTELVEAGIITQEQADAILATMPEPPQKPEI